MRPCRLKPTGRNVCRRRAGRPSVPSSAACCATTASSLSSCSSLRQENFYSDANQKIYKAISDLNDKGGQPVDVVLLAEELKQRGQIEDIGGYSYLAELWEAAPTAANAEYYARIVRDRAVVRNLIHASTEILRDAYDQAQPADELVEQADARFSTWPRWASPARRSHWNKPWPKPTTASTTRNTGEQMSISGLSTGYTDLNEITAGLQNARACYRRGAAVRRQNVFRPEHCP